jgi:hypothetical protein
VGCIEWVAHTATSICVGCNIGICGQRALVCSLRRFRSRGLEDWLLPLVVLISVGGIGPVRSTAAAKHVSDSCDALTNRSLSASLSPSDARRRIRRPAAAAKSPGSSPDTDSLPRTICVWVTRSAPVTSNSTAPTSRVPPEDSRFHARRYAPSAGTSPASTRRSLGLDATSRRKAVSRYRSGGVDHLKTGSSVNSPSGCRCKKGRARLLGGEFEIHSEPGKGTRIEVWVPLRLNADQVKS